MSDIRLEKNPTQISNNYFNGYGGSDYSKTYLDYTVHPKMIYENLVYNDIDFESILDVGCASGELVKDLRNLGLKAYGIENNPYIMSKNIVPQWCILMDLRNLKTIKNNTFDVLYVNSLMYLDPKEIPGVLKEMFRICKKAVYLCTPFLEDPYFKDPSRKFVASIKWWKDQFEKAGFSKVTRNIYKKD